MFDGLVRVLTWLAMVVLIPMMFLVPADVIGRYLLKKPIPAVFEINAYFLMVAVVFFPLAFVQQKRGHIYVNLFTQKMPERAKGVLDAFSTALGVFAYGLIGWFGLKMAIHSTEVREYVSGIIDVPIWISKWFVPLGAFVFCLQLIRDMVHHIHRATGARTGQE
jgi:TRAP-type C4-dicarboxylate transport system permease small subunit